MSDTLDELALGRVLKIQYDPRTVNNICYGESTLFARMAKNTKFGGLNWQIAFQYGSPQGRGAAFAVGQANATPSVYSAVNVPRARDYVFANIAGDMVDAAKLGDFSMLDGMKSEISNAFYTAGRSIANTLFGNGGGSRGRIGATTVLTTNQLILADPNSVVNFEINMQLNLAATDGTTGIKETGVVQVTAVDRENGILTLSAPISTAIPTAAIGDYIFQNGDFETPRSLPTGLAGWIPMVPPAPGDNFFGIDRSVDVTRLSGLRWTKTQGGPIEETIQKCAARLVLEGGKPDLIVVNPLDFANISIALGSKVIILNSQLPDADIGVTGLQMHGPKGPLDIISDNNCPTGQFYMLTLSTWTFKSLLEAPRVLGESGDGLRLLRNPTTDSYQIRIGYYGNIGCNAPGWNAVGLL
ncbi:MAG: hypothetical protein FWD69_10145 [Polyangiaceae bacterium]|nr:hypothetical protein [Polyangiaceae bacterium]